MTESKNRQWILNARPVAKLTGEEFRWNEAPIPQASDRQVLVRNPGCRSTPRSASGCRATPTKRRFRLAVSWSSLLSDRYSSRVILTSSRQISCEAVSAGRTTA